MNSSKRWTRGFAVVCSVGVVLGSAACSSNGSASSSSAAGGASSSAAATESSAAGPGSSAPAESASGSGAATPTEAANPSKPGLDYCGGGAGGADIVLGGTFTKTPFAFGNDAEATINQVFKDCNDKGGINGRKIKYVSGDDGGDPTKTAALARKNVDAGAIAIVGSASFTECGANRQFYHDNDLIALQAVGVDPFCFNSPDIAGVTVSPFAQVTTDLYYASETLKDNKLCFFQPVTPGTTDAIVAAIDQWKKITGKTLTIDDHNIPTNETSFTTELARAKSAGCDAIIYGGGDTVGASMIKDAKTQGMTNVDFMFVSVSYTQQLAKAVGSLGMRVYATTDMFPFTSQDPVTDVWRKTAEAAKAQQTAFSEAAFVCGNWVLYELAQINGDITKESFNAQLKGPNNAYTSPLVPVPLTFGDAAAHNRTSGINMMNLKDGAWQPVEAVALPQS